MKGRAHPEGRDAGGREAEGAGPARPASPNPLWSRIATAEASLGRGAGPEADGLEREADRLADRLTRDAASRPPLSAPVAGSSPTAGSVASDGRPLAPALRSYFEPRLGRDLGAVRIHSGAEASDTARSLGARALARGPDVVFGAGRYRPDTGDGLRRLAHELVHVAQQGGAAGAPPAAAGRAGGPMAVTRAGPALGPQYDGGAGYRETTVTVRWSDDSVELYHRVVAAARRSSELRGARGAAFWQPLHGPVLRFHRRHSGRHPRDLDDGDRVEIHVAGFYDPDDTPGLSNARVWHDEDTPAPAPAPTPAPTPAPSPPPAPRPDLQRDGKIRWDPETPERVFITGTGVTPRLIAADLYGDESQATQIWAFWNEKERGGPFTVSTELPVGSWVGIKYRYLRPALQTLFDASVTIIGRDIWGARQPIVDDPSRSYEPYTADLDTIYDSIAVHHSGNSGYRTMREVQDHHMDEQDRADVGYHYGITLGGYVYEGRPIGVKGAHIPRGNTGKIGIVLLADLDEQVWDSDDEVTPEMDAALLRLIHYLIGRYPRIAFLGGHQEYTSDRTCPGNLAMDRMNRWRSSTGLGVPARVP